MITSQFRSASAASIVIFSYAPGPMPTTKIVLKILPSSPPQPVQLLHRPLPFFLYQSAAGKNCAALTDIVNSCNLLHKRRRRKFPLRRFQFFCRKGPVLPAILFHQLQNSRLLRFQINTCRLSNCFWRNPGRRKCRKNLFFNPAAGVFFLQPMPTVITFGIR